MSNTVMSVSQARAALPRLLQLVEAGEEVTLTRHGDPVAVIVRPDTLRARRAGDRSLDADRVRALVARGRRETLRPRPTLTEQRADELLADLRAARSSR